MIDIICFDGERFELSFNKLFYLKEFNTYEAKSEEKLRKILTNKNLDFIYSAERNSKNDRLHHKNSGLNQITLRMMRKNKIAYAFNFSDLLDCPSDLRMSQLLGKMVQNVSLCRKFKVKMILSSFAKNKWQMRNPYDLMAFGRTIGMTGKESKDALNFSRKERDIEELR